MSRYIESARVVIDEGAEERVKGASRMYEQWVFFQIASALRSAGLRCEDAQELPRRRSRRRFTLDLDRDTRLTFRAANGRAISLRYEPWIVGMLDARARRDTVYRGRGGERAWSPDILMEVLSSSSMEGEAPLVEHAAVVDTKYSWRIGDRHWDGVETLSDAVVLRAGILAKSAAQGVRGDERIQFLQSTVRKGLCLQCEATTFIVES